MSVTREELAAFADGELEEPRRTQVAAEVAQDPALAAEVERHKALKARLGAHFAPVLDQPVPERLTAALGMHETKVADFTAHRQRRAAIRFPRWGWVVGPALAASLVLAVVMPQGGHAPDRYADARLASLLDNQLVAEQSGDQSMRVLLSFRDEAGAYCRAYAGTGRSGIACRDAEGWQLRFTGAGRAGQASDYRMAGAETAALLERAQDMAVGPALDPAEEEAAKAAGWR